MECTSEQGLGTTPMITLVYNLTGKKLAFMLSVHISEYQLLLPTYTFTHVMHVPRPSPLFLCILENSHRIYKQGRPGNKANDNLGERLCITATTNNSNP